MSRLTTSFFLLLCGVLSSCGEKEKPTASQGGSATAVDPSPVSPQHPASVPGSPEAPVADLSSANTADLQIAAVQGSAEAMATVAHVLDLLATAPANLRGISADMANALEEAALGGEPSAYFALAELQRLKILPGSPLRLLKYYQLAADAGHADAQAELARCLESGIGTGVDKDRSRSLYQDAAGRGSGRAKVRVARFYENGDGVPKDPLMAYLICSEPEAAALSEAVELKKRITAQLPPQSRRLARRMENVLSSNP